MRKTLARAVASSGIFLLLPLFVQAQASSFSVGTATAAPGQKSTGYLEVPAGVDAATNIPVIVINGEKPGRVLALVSGAHGTEYTSIIALENELRGRLSAREFTAADTDKDGTLSKDEYLAVVEQRFKAADADNDGTLTRQELKTKAGRQLLRLLR
jgi:hypothetical protein